MNRYLMIRRLRGPVFLLLVGFMALMAQADILGWGKSWPLFLIMAGVFALAERAAMASEESIYPGPGQPPYPGQPYPGQTYPGQTYPGQPYAGPVYPGQPYPGQPYPDPSNAGAPAADAAASSSDASTDAGTALVPASPQAIEKSSEGGWQ